MRFCDDIVAILSLSHKINFAPSRLGDEWPPENGGSNNISGQAGGSGMKAMVAKPDDCKKMFIGYFSYDIMMTALPSSLGMLMRGVAFAEFWNE